MFRSRRGLLLVPLVAAAGSVLALGVAGVPDAPAQGSSQVARERPQRLAVGVEILRFNAAGRRATASGVVTARLIDNAGHVTTARTRVAMIAATGGSCRVLHLYLNKLDLTLLGLHAHLDRVVLNITGNRGGGVLGSLFCKLASARIAARRAAAARALTARMRRSVVRFNAWVRPVRARSAAAGTVCPVLDLVIGPLNLQLLGLVVDLNQVHLTVTATRGAGALGDLFCQLADNNQSGTASG